MSYKMSIETKNSIENYFLAIQKAIEKDMQQQFKEQSSGTDVKAETQKD